MTHWPLSSAPQAVPKCLFTEQIFEGIIQDQWFLQTYFPQVPQLTDLCNMMNYNEIHCVDLLISVVLGAGVVLWIKVTQCSYWPATHPCEQQCGRSPLPDRWAGHGGVDKSRPCRCGLHTESMCMQQRVSTLFCSWKWGLFCNMLTKSDIFLQRFWTQTHIALHSKGLEYSPIFLIGMEVRGHRASIEMSHLLFNILIHLQNLPAEKPPYWQNCHRARLRFLPSC